MSKLKKYRNKKGWTQVKLSQNSGVSQSFIHAIETGKKNPTTKTVKKLAAALEILPSELLDDEDEDEEKSA